MVISSFTQEKTLIKHHVFYVHVTVAVTTCALDLDMLTSKTDSFILT